MDVYLKGQTGDLNSHAKGQEWSEEKRDALVAAVFGPAVTLCVYIITNYILILFLYFCYSASRTKEHVIDPSSYVGKLIFFRVSS